ncbi:unnamed protein product [Malus baccata var. baccata]
MSFISKQWAGVWSSSSVLDFNEGGYEEILDCQDNLGDQHRKLDKLRLHMTGYLVTVDTTIVDELLSCSFERNVKELDINLRLCRLVQRNWHEKKNYYCLSRTTFLDAKSITTLCLEATINTPNLNSISLKAPNLCKATTLLCDFWDVQFPTAFNGAWKHLPVLAGFLKEFGRSKNLDLIVAAFKNVIFPTEFRSTSSCAILPGLNNNLALKVSNYLETDSDISELEDSLTWIAPSAWDISVNKIIGTILFE